MKVGLWDQKEVGEHDKVGIEFACRHVYGAM